MFYDRYAELCKQKGLTMSAAAVEAGISKSLVTKWKTHKTRIPSPDVLQKLSAYFGVPVSDLIEEKETPLVNGDEELTEYLEMLKTRPEIRMLFQLSKDATKEDVEKAVAIIEAIRK